MTSIGKRLLVAAVLMATASIAVGQATGTNGRKGPASSSSRQTQALPDGGPTAAYLVLSGGLSLGAILVSYRRRTKVLPNAG